VKNHIHLKDSVLDIFLTKTAINYRDNFEIIENYLFLTGNFLTQKMIQKLLNEYGKVNDIFSIFMLIKLCKMQSISVPFEMIDLEPSLLKKVIYFLIDNSEINLEDNFITTLSKDNQIYYVKNFLGNRNMTLDKNDFSEIVVETSKMTSENKQEKDFSIKTSESLLEEYDYIKY
jgi:hypothetical protein